MEIDRACSLLTPLARRRTPGVAGDCATKLRLYARGSDLLDEPSGQPRWATGYYNADRDEFGAQVEVSARTATLVFGAQMDPGRPWRINYAYPSEVVGSR